ncbi:Crp/Fnr family transcriptional regulator [Desulfovermiculus halophilus]|uniref:Crp/Fnr family transcriptional regulator n=1 Tax=Desulfovermiculus halophilus TaxID=339722 RepID=UPI00047FE1B0|nr:Crp/Fnr family transcriptional regulator [Desulfovermiculus halophilus]
MHNASRSCGPPIIRHQGANRVWREVLHLGTRCTFPAGHVQPGIPGEGLYFLTQGTVRLAYTSLDGQERVVLIIGQDSLFNEIPSLKSQVTPGVGFQCIEPVEAWRFPVSLLTDQEFISAYPHLISNLLQSMAIKSTSLFSHATEGILCSTPRRLCQVLLSMAQNRQHFGLSQTDVANMLGVHQTTIARSVRTLRKQGIIGRFTKKELQILDQERLAAIAEGRLELGEEG